VSDKRRRSWRSCRRTETGGKPEGRMKAICHITPPALLGLVHLLENGLGRSEGISHDQGLANQSVQHARGPVFTFPLSFRRVGVSTLDKGVDKQQTKLSQRLSPKNSDRRDHQPERVLALTFLAAKRDVTKFKTDQNHTESHAQS
jgi:hypothetical protein